MIEGMFDFDYVQSARPDPTSYVMTHDKLQPFTYFAKGDGTVTGGGFTSPLPSSYQPRRTMHVANQYAATIGNFVTDFFQSKVAAAATKAGADAASGAAPVIQAQLDLAQAQLTATLQHEENKMIGYVSIALAAVTLLVIINKNK